ncbi:MAG: hypothetical protein M3365_05080, partial [Gemmatimonadota bacterium]|nr:hypothetical protein [Gemmatimonadota bacterium]
MPLRLDYSNMMISPGGVGADQLASSAAEFSASHDRFEERRRSGSLGFVDLPAQKQLLEQVTRYARTARGKYDDVVILGIG